MADFAPARTADASGFADGEVREIVVQDEFLFGFAAGVGIEFLRVVAGAQRGQRERLGFAPAEQRRAMRARQKADFARNRAHDIKGAAVETFAVVQNQTANAFLLDVVKRVVDDKVRDFFRAKFFHKFLPDLVLDRLAGVFAGEFAGREQRGHETVAGELLGFLEDFVGNDVERDFAFLLAGPGGEFLLRGDERLAAFLAELERGVEVGLGNFLSRAFIHHDVFFVANVNEVEVALGLFRVRRVGDEFSVDASNAHRAERAGPRNVADHQRRARADDAQNDPDRFRHRR